MMPLVYEIELLETNKRILRVLRELEKTLKEILEELKKLNSAAESLLKDCNS